ncbi:MAG: extracellular solute-binding protein [Firmicutes bacterium]|nr:extracellular solute-binding protein [Bacillota bacterium]
MKGRLWWVVVASVGIALFAGGVSVAQGSNVIHFLSVQQETEGFTRIIGELAREYETQHPNVQYKYEFVAQTDLLRRIQLLAANRNLPTLFNYESGQPLRQLIDSGLVLDIEATFKELGLYDRLNPAAVKLLKGLVGDAGLYALPLELNVEGFWYNKELFARYGLGVPQTWDDLLQAAETFHRNGIQPFAVSGIQKWPITRLINGYVMRRYGHDVMARVQRAELKVTDEGFIEAARVVQEMGLKGYFGRGVNTLDYAPAQDLFLQGRAAMYYMGSWALRDFNNPQVNLIGPENIGFFNIPLVEDGVGTLADYSINAGLTTSISSNAYDAELGEWLKYVFARYGDRAMSVLGMITGFRVEAVPHDVPALTRLVLEHLDQAQNGAPWFEAYFGPRATSVAWDNAQLLVTGDITPEQYMAELQRALDGER